MLTTALYSDIKNDFMPNAHDKSKVQTGFWSDKELLTKVRAILKKRGLTLTDEIIKMMESIAKEELKNETESKKSK